MRIGHSYDCHQLIEDRKLILGGIEIEHEKGLLGHSDADVLIHAIGESLLGAMGLGDLGTHFPDTDDVNKDLNSQKILLYVNHLLKEQSYEIGNIDSIIYAQKPKMKNHIPLMQVKIAQLLEIRENQINIKATTGEKMGFVGREEGIAAESVCIIKELWWNKKILKYY